MVTEMGVGCPFFFFFFFFFSSELEIRFMGGLQKSNASSFFSQLFVNWETWTVETEMGEACVCLDVMFHVSTMLEFSEKDKQQLHRKRHIGNDVVVIVFRDYGTATKFVPNFRSQFNKVYLVVQPHTVCPTWGDALSYMIQVCVLQGVPPFGPMLPCNPFYKEAVPKEKLREFLLIKCLNAEQASMSDPSFKGMFRAVRKGFLQKIKV